MLVGTLKIPFGKVSFVDGHWKSSNPRLQEFMELTYPPDQISPADGIEGVAYLEEAGRFFGVEPEFAELPEQEKGVVY